MTIMRWNPRPFLSDLFDDLYDPDYQLTQRTHGYMPPVNISENKDSFMVEMAVPGRKKDDFKVNLDNNILSITCEQETEEKEEKKEYTRREYHYASFCRSFTLPKSVEQDKIKADYREGILFISLPKKEEEKMKLSREIKIS